MVLYSPFRNKASGFLFWGGRNQFRWGFGYHIGVQLILCILKRCVNVLLTCEYFILKDIFKVNKKPYIAHLYPVYRKLTLNTSWRFVKKNNGEYWEKEGGNGVKEEIKESREEGMNRNTIDRHLCNETTCFMY